MSDQEVFTEWERTGLGGKQHKVLHVDSATDWGSCLELCECAVALRADMEAIKARRHALPEVLTEDMWDYIKANIVFLTMIERTY